jgi:tRNA threonylcarbamoyladenosine biosynthesis protein TsaB
MTTPPIKRLLVIDCATPALSVALFDGITLVAATHQELGRGHAEALLPAIAALPDGGRADEILVDIGPGSFTGVRVGLAAAKALSFAWQVPVRGFGCLDLVAAIARDQLRPSEPFAVTMVGGHGELFWAKVSPSDQGPDAAPLVVRSTPVQELASMIDVSLLVGSGAAQLVSAGARAEAVQLLPDARAVFKLPPAQRTRPASPEYGRGADAQPMANVRPRGPAKVA